MDYDITLRDEGTLAFFGDSIICSHRFENEPEEFWDG
jgi:hypothetical protein